MRRLLVLTFAQLGRHCYLWSAGRDRALLARLCQLARIEMDFLAQTIDFQMPGLMMEFSEYLPTQTLKTDS